MSKEETAVRKAMGKPSTSTPPSYIPEPIKAIWDKLDESTRASQAREYDPKNKAIREDGSHGADALGMK